MTAGRNSLGDVIRGADDEVAEGNTTGTARDAMADARGSGAQDAANRLRETETRPVNGVFPLNAFQPDSGPGNLAEAEAEPPVAALLFGDRIDLVRQFTADLAQFGEQLGLIGPLEMPRLWSRHIINSVLLAPLLKPGRVGDIGSGAGLPGLVLAIARPDVHMILIEPMERRVEWLQREAAALELQNVEVVRARAEEVKLSPWLDQVTARAVSALSKLIPLTVPLVRSGGELLFLKGASVQAELDSATKVVRRHRLSDVEILILGEGQVDEVTRVFRATVD